jgi:hypothetical protein
MVSGSFANRGRLVVWIALAGLALGGSQGCSGGGAKGDPNGREVTGKVVYQGNPVEGAAVTFRGASVSAFGQTDAEGKYKLRVSSGEQVPLGTYQVSIVKKESLPVSTASSDQENYVPPDPNAPPVPAPAPKDLLPARYGDAAKSGLTATVTADGKNEFDFPLSD